MRGSGRTIPLQDCGLAPTSRFVIFDHGKTLAACIHEYFFRCPLYFVLSIR